MPAKKIVIDADPGVGDALAIILALLDPDLDVLGVTATSGAVGTAQATRNIQSIVHHVDPGKWPRVGGATIEIPPIELLTGTCPEEINGPSGLGEYEPMVADLHHRVDAPRLLIDLVRENPHEVTVLTLGPLTNIQAAIERAPEFIDQIGSLVSLAGAVGAGGDATAVAEYNVFRNPDAASHVLRSPITKTLIPLDVALRPILTFDRTHLFPARESLLGRLLHGMVPFALRAMHEHRGMEGLPLQEVAALASISRSQLVHTDRASIEIELNGKLTRGMTVVDRRRVSRLVNANVATEIDSQGVLDYFRQIMGLARC